MVKFTKGENNLISEFQLNLMGDPLDTARVYERTNPFSGDRVKLNSFQANLYDLITETYADLAAGLKPMPVAKFDRLKYLFLKLDSESYMRLLD